MVQNLQNKYLNDSDNTATKNTNDYNLENSRINEKRENDQNVNSNNEIVTEVRINEMTEELFKCHHCNVFCTYNHTKNPVFNRDCNFKYNWLCNSCAFLNYISNNDKIK